MSGIQIVTDSTSAFPEKLIQEYDIQVVPIGINWEGKTYLDGIDLPRDEFFQRMKSTYEMPTTSAPMPGQFKLTFERAGQEGKPILAILMGEEFSSTVRTASIAKEALPELDITVFDTHSISMGLGFQVLAAARAAEEGTLLEDILAMLENMVDKTGVLLAVKDIDFLRRGGRLNRAQWTMAKALGQKPILEVRAGPIEAVDRARSERGVRARIFDLLEKRAGDQRPLRLAVGYSDNQSVAESVMRQLDEEFQPDELFVFPISQANSVHGGAGTYGVAYCVGV